MCSIHKERTILCCYHFLTLSLQYTKLSFPEAKYLACEQSLGCSQATKYRQKESVLTPDCKTINKSVAKNQLISCFKVTCIACYFKDDSLWRPKSGKIWVCPKRKTVPVSTQNWKPVSQPGNHNCTNVLYS